jgi:WD40 repeat protein
MTIKSVRHLAAPATILLVVALSLGAVMFALSRTAECGASRWGEALSPSRAKDSHGLPRLRLLRTLSAFNEQYPLLGMQSGNSGLTWSPDGERLAAYVRAEHGIQVWSPDGKVQYEIPTGNMAGAGGPDDVLGFLAGHSQLLTSLSRSEENPPPEGTQLLSVLDAETGKVLHYVMAQKPEIGVRYNTVSKAAISPDQHLVAVIYHDLITGERIDRRIGIYSTDNWRRIAAIAFGDDMPNGADAIAFSPDGTLLAVAYENMPAHRDARVDIFSVDSWERTRSIKTFPDAPPKTINLRAGAIRFNHDGSMIAVIMDAGGAYWKNSNGEFVSKGSGTLFQSDLPEPLRVFKISNGMPIASAGGFSSGFEKHKMEWSPRDNFIEFLDLDGFLYLWNPTPGDPPQEKCQLPHSTTVVTFSPDGTLLSQGFADGVNLYELK